MTGRSLATDFPNMASELIPIYSLLPKPKIGIKISGKNNIPNMKSDGLRKAFPNATITWK